jgi:hypothetical protein
VPPLASPSWSGVYSPAKVDHFLRWIEPNSIKIDIAESTCFGRARFEPMISMKLIVPWNSDGPVMVGYPAWRTN